MNRSPRPLQGGSMRIIHLALAVALLFASASLQASVITYNLTTAENANSGNLNPDGIWTFLAGTTILPYNIIPPTGSCLSAYPGLSSDFAAGNATDRKSVVQGKSVDL